MSQLARFSSQTSRTHLRLVTSAATAFSSSPSPRLPPSPPPLLIINLIRSPTAPRLSAVFRFFDRDGSGVISAGEFRHSCDLLNDLLPGAGTHIATHARTP